MDGCNNSLIIEMGLDQRGIFNSGGLYMQWSPSICWDQWRGVGYSIFNGAYIRELFSNLDLLVLCSGVLPPWSLAK